jgi:hypothetical protein
MSQIDKGAQPAREARGGTDRTPLFVARAVIFVVSQGVCLARCGRPSLNVPQRGLARHKPARDKARLQQKTSPEAAG